MYLANKYVKCVICNYRNYLLILNIINKGLFVTYVVTVICLTVCVRKCSQNKICLYKLCIQHFITYNQIYRRLVYDCTQDYSGYPYAYIFYIISRP